ncbi:MAG: hypothetical protein WD579_00535 [Candidatus Paceibacterota bacterium]
MAFHDSENQEYISIEAAAHLTGWSEDHIMRLCRARVIESVYKGEGKWHIDKVLLEEYRQDLEESFYLDEEEANEPHSSFSLIPMVRPVVVASLVFILIATPFVASSFSGNTISQTVSSMRSTVTYVVDHMDISHSRVNSLTESIRTNLSQAAFALASLLAPPRTVVFDRHNALNPEGGGSIAGTTTPQTSLSLESSSPQIIERVVYEERLVYPGVSEAELSSRLRLAAQETVQRDETIANILSSLSNKLSDLTFIARRQDENARRDIHSSISQSVSTQELSVSGNSAFDTDTLYIDADNNRVGVLTTTPAYTLDVGGTLNAEGTTITSLSVSGDATISGNFTVSGSQTLSGAITVPYIQATSTTATSTFAGDISVSGLSEVGTVTSGTWQGTAIGDGYITKTGDWTGTLDGQEGVYYLDARNLTNFGTPFHTFFSATTTDALSEGSNLYWTNTRFDERLSATTTLPNITTLANLSVTESQISDLDHYTDTDTAGYINASSTILKSNTESGLESFLAGVVNVFTNNDGALSDDDLSDNTTTDLAEGSNLYFTNARADARINATSTIATLFSTPNLATVGTLTSGTWNANTLAVAYGGTGAVTASGARTNLGLAIGSDVQAYSAILDAVSAGTYTGDDSITTLGTISTGVWNGTAIDISTYTNLSVSATGLELSGDALALSSGYTIPLSTSVTNWDNFYTTPSTRITAGTNISWNSNTLNVDDAFLINSGDDTTTGQLTANNFVASNASATSTFAGGFDVGSGNLVVDWSSGRVGVGTSAPTRVFEVFDTVANAQLRIAYDASRRSEFQVDATGNVILSASGGTVSFLDEDFNVCAGGACPSVSVSGGGNIVVENKVVAEEFERHCPTGYIWVPGSAKHGTLPGFCVMKYEAKNVSGVATSQANSNPWVSITQTDARAQCEALGDEYHLISNAEWMTIADNVSKQTGNWADGVIGSTVASGGGLLRGNIGITDSVSYDGSNPESGTGRNTKAELALSNAETIWDFSGNVWEWVDAYIIEDDTAATGNGNDNDGITMEMVKAGNVTTPNWFEYTAVTDYQGHDLRPWDISWDSTYGIGKIYINPGHAYDGVGYNSDYHAFRRGGGWDDADDAGVFTLYLSSSPSYTNSNFGFRCAW